MSAYEFMSSNPWLTFFLALITTEAIRITFAYCINRPLRHRNIKLHGWPPAHVDADGDFKKEPKQ